MEIKNGKNAKYLIGFVILTWNSALYIKNCLDSILDFRQIECKIAVCDNGSTDGTVDLLKAYENNERVFVTYLKENLGTTKSRNIALKNVLDCDLICVLDSDTVLSDYDGFLKMCHFLCSHEDIGIIGPQLVGKDGTLQHSGRNIPSFKEKILKASGIKSFNQEAETLESVDYSLVKKDAMAVGYLMSACWLFKRDLIDKIGYLDEKIFYAPEDVEYCLRCWKYNLKVVYFKKCSILHYWQRISKKKKISKHNLEHIKGLLYIKRKYNLKAIQKKVDACEN